MKAPCRYCDDTGWFYADEELGPCGCEATFDWKAIGRAILMTVYGNMPCAESLN